jgi:hypothetical protein
MPYPIAAGSGLPAYDAFIPELWSGKLIEKFYDATVLAQIANTDYEGEIKNHGDTVHIRTIPSVTVRNYQRGTPLQTERPDAPEVELQIDKGKYFQAELDDVAKVQTDMDMLNLWSQDASEQMKIAVDGDVLNVIGPDAVAANKGAAAGRISQSINLGTTGAPVLLSSANVIDWIVDQGQVLDEQNVPETGRWLVLPSWITSLIKKSDIRNASISGGDQSLYRNGRIGEIDNFTIYKSNVLTSVVDGTRRCFRPLAGHRNALTFASQMTKMETLRSQSSFADIVRGLQIYGFKVVDGTCMVSSYVAKA